LDEKGRVNDHCVFFLKYQGELWVVEEDYGKDTEEKKSEE